MCCGRDVEKEKERKIYAFHKKGFCFMIIVFFFFLANCKFCWLNEDILPTVTY